MLPDKVTTLCSIPHSSFLVRTEVQPCSICLVLVIMSTVTMCMQIVKQEWPHNWTTFVSDIVGASKTSESLCTNNMAILKLLRSSILYTESCWV